MPWQGPFPQTYDRLDGRYDYYTDPYRWPYYKFDGHFKLEDIWGDLHQKYNTAPIAILDRAAWHADLVAAMEGSESPDEVYAMLEESKERRLDELKSAIASVDKVSSFNFEYGTRLRRLGDAMEDLRTTASVYNAFDAFRAMSEFVVEQVEQLIKLNEENERALERASPTKNRRNISFSSDVQADTTPSVGNVSASPNSPGPRSQPRLPSPTRKPGADTNIPPKNTKRKWDEADNASVPKKKLRGTPPVSPGRACANQPTGPSNQKENKDESSQDESGTPTSQQRHSSQNTSINQEQSTPDVKFTAESFSESETDGSTVVKAEPPLRASSPVTARSPMAEHNDRSLASTQIENPRIHYKSLGWEEDPGPSPKPLPSGQQQDEVHPSVLQSARGLGRPALGHGQNDTHDRPTAGS